MSPSEEAPEAPGSEPASGSEPAFAEPWQARAFALAVLASRRGCFTWSEWTQALGRELRQAAPAQPAPAQPASGQSASAQLVLAQPAPAQAAPGAPGYFDCWLVALQSLLLGKGAVGPDELSARKQAWADAYRRTPHGTPVSLSDPQRI